MLESEQWRPPAAAYGSCLIHSATRRNRLRLRRLWREENGEPGWMDPAAWLPEDALQHRRRVLASIVFFRDRYELPQIRDVPEQRARSNPGRLRISAAPSGFHPTHRPRRHCAARWPALPQTLCGPFE